MEAFRPRQRVDSSVKMGGGDGGLFGDQMIFGRKDIYAKPDIRNKQIFIVLLNNKRAELIKSTWELNEEPYKAQWC